MPDFYHFIREQGEVRKSLQCSSLHFYRPDQSVSKSSPTWGDNSDGSVILGYSILKDAVGDDKARHCFKAFVNQVLSGLTLNEWRISKGQLDEFCDYVLNMEGVAYEAVSSAMNSDTWNQPIKYQTIPSGPLWRVSPNSLLAVPSEESIAKS